MSLEEEAERQRLGPPPRGPATVRMPAGWDRFFRLLALGILAVGAFAVLWVPIVLLAPLGAVAVVALVTLALVAVAARLHELRVRVDALEERLGATSEPGPEPPPDAPPEDRPDGP
jgi:hypothetical protein